MIPERFFVNWYTNQGRNFPWRKESASPYQLLVTEMLLRQTDAESVSRVWQSLFEQYPTIQSLSEADQERLESLIGVLGFGKMRSKALIDAAQHLCSAHGAEVPNDRAALMEIPHVGRYAAGAICCFAYGEATPIVDNSIKRFLGRYFGEDYDRDIRRAEDAWQRAEELLPSTSEAARAHNYGLLDFIAQVCTARNPNCGECPIRTNCKYPAEENDPQG